MNESGISAPAPFPVAILFAVFWAWLGWLLFNRKLLLWGAVAGVTFWLVSLAIVYLAVLRLLGRQ